MFLSQEIDIKLCQNYTKTCICKIYVRITRSELPPMAVQYTGHVIQTEPRDNTTALPLVGVLVTCSIISIKNEKLFNSNNDRS